MRTSRSALVTYRCRCRWSGPNTKADSTAVGTCSATRSSNDAYGPSGQNDFTGDVSWIRLDAGDDAEDPDHYIDPGHRLTTILKRQ